MRSRRALRLGVALLTLSTEGRTIRNEESVQHKQNDVAFQAVGKGRVQSLKKNLPSLETAK